MGINFAPKSPGLPSWEEEDAGAQDELNLPASPEADPVNQARLPSGWWILPFAAGGLLECYLVIDWIFGHL